KTSKTSRSARPVRRSSPRQSVRPVRERREIFRHERVERAILEELRSLLAAEVSDPCLGGAWIVDVQVSPDGKNARASYAVRSTGDEADVARVTKEAFARAAGFLRAR